jgi:thiamine biosynthesis lipoprotein
MSLFKENSALRQLNREGVLAHPPAHLLAVLKQAQHYAQHSGGAFDATVQPLWEVFAQAQLSGALPSAAQIQTARRLVNWRDVSVGPERVALARAGMGVTLNGIAQGYASDQLRQVLQAHGVADALVNAGEWSASGHSPRSDDWVIGLASPQPSDTLLAKLHVSGACVATSADDQTHFSEDHRHHHIFDPHTGYSPTDIASVSVVAPTCTQADALTKVLFVAGYDKALSVAQQWKVQALVVHKSGRHQMSKDLPLA